MLRAAGIMGLMTVVSRVLGLWRDRLMAGIFGASGVNDAFQFAFLIPNLTRRLFGEGAMTSSFVPVFSDRMVKEGPQSAFRTASIVITRLALTLFVVCALAAAISFGVRHVAPLKENVSLTMKLCETMIFYCIFMNVAAVLMAVLNALDHFFMPALAPVLLNLCMIVACKWGLDLMGSEPAEQIFVVSLSVLAGGLLQLLILLPPAFLRGFSYKPSLNKDDQGVKDIKAAFMPVVLGVAFFQVNQISDQMIALYFIPEPGPVTMLSYGSRLIQLPWAIFSLSVATAALPLLSRHWAEGRKEEYARGLGAACRNTLYLAIPSAVGLCLLSTDLVRLLYGTGEFLRNDGEAVKRTGQVVFWMSLGLPFYGLNAVLTRAVYAMKDAKTPTRITIISVAANLVLNLVFVLGTPMKESGLALASTLSAVLQTLLLSRVIYKRLPQTDTKRVTGFLGVLGGGCAGGVLVAMVVYSKLSQNKNLEGFIAFLVAAACSIAPLWALGHYYFEAQLKPLVKEGAADNPDLFYNVEESRWPSDLLFFHAVFTCILSSTAMGFMVWATRDSLQEGTSFALVVQRAVVPVAIGILLYAMFSGTVRSREYEELKMALARRRKKPAASAPSQS